MKTSMRLSHSSEPDLAAHEAAALAEAEKAGLDAPRQTGKTAYLLALTQYLNQAGQ